MLRLLAAVGAFVLMASPAGASEVPVGADLPPALQALVTKMGQLQVTSERFSQVITGFVTITSEQNGKPIGHRRRVSLNTTSIGVASLTPSEGEVSSAGSLGRSKAIQIGSTLYDYSSKLARVDGGRPWVRLPNPGVSLFPYHGGSLEVNAGGSGPYAGLINLLTTAIGEVVDVGAATVDEQQTSEFELTVDPVALVSGLTQEDLADLEQHPLDDRLTIYLAESGLPVRVLSSEHAGKGANALSSTATTDILAVDVPVTVKAPPARKTISQARANRLSKKHSIELP